MSLENSPETDSGDDGRSITDTKVGRRAFVAGVGASALAVGGAGSVAAQSEGINFASDYAHESVLSATTTFSKVDFSRFGELEYEDDSGSIRDLSSTHGVRLAPRPEPPEDGSPVAHNPVEYPLRSVESDEFTDFPRETYELDGDGNPDENLPVSWTDSTFWTPGSGMTITEASGDALLFSGTDDSATFSFSEWSITEDERKKNLLVVLDVVSLSTGATVSISAVDSSGSNPSATALVDDAGDPEADDVIATSVGDGYLYQMPLGELEPGVASIDEVEVSVTGTAEVRLHGLNLDRTSPLSFGTREYVETDEDGNETLETESVEEHNSGGPVAITSLGTVDAALGDAILRDVAIDVEQRARDLPAEFVATERSDTPTGYEYEDRYTIGFTHELPSAYDLSHNVTGVDLRGAVSTSRYFEVGYSSPSMDPESIDDYQDLTLTDVTSQLDPTATDPEVQLATSIVATDGVDVVIDLALTPDETRDLTGGMGGFALASGSSGGSDGPLSGVRGVILMIASLVGAVVAWTRGRL